MRADNPNLCKAAYEKGIKLFDTANGYQNGNNETMLGNLLKNYPRTRSTWLQKSNLLVLTGKANPPTRPQLRIFFRNSIPALRG